MGRQLALIGDDINRRYDTEFQNLLEQLQPTAGNAYELFTKIASRYQPVTPPRVHVTGSRAGEQCHMIPSCLPLCPSLTLFCTQA